MIEHATTDATTDTGAAGDSAGDVLTFANEVFDRKDENKVGTDQGYCIRVVPGGSYECNFTTLLAGGQIVVEGPFYDSKDSSSRSRAVPGGTAMRVAPWSCKHWKAAPSSASPSTSSVSAASARTAAPGADATRDERAQAAELTQRGPENHARPGRALPGAIACPRSPALTAPRQDGGTLDAGSNRTGGGSPTTRLRRATRVGACLQRVQRRARPRRRWSGRP